MAVPSDALRSHNVFETIVSALVIVVALAFLVFFYASTGTGRFGSYELSARMADASGLDLNADIRVGGIKVGSVTGLTVMPKTYLAIVHFRVRDDLFLPVDSRLSITYPQMGNAYLTIQPGHSRSRMNPGGEFQLPANRPAKAVLKLSSAR